MSPVRTEFLNGRFLIHYQNMWGRWRTGQGDLEFTAEVEDSGRWLVAPADFGSGGEAIIPDVDDEGEDEGDPTVVRLARTAEGCIDPKSGQAQLSLELTFTRSVVTVRLKLDLSTTTSIDEGMGRVVRGMPLEPSSGQVQLAGQARFAGAPMTGRRCLAQFSGRFGSLPWPLQALP